MTTWVGYKGGEIVATYGCRQDGDRALERREVEMTAPWTNRIVDVRRRETDSCQRSTPGCCVDHTAETEAGVDGRHTTCEGW